MTVKLFQSLSVCWLSLCVAVFFSIFSVSAENLSLTPQNGSGSTEISVTATAASKPVFTVSIPSGIPMGEIVRSNTADPVSAEFDVVFSGITYLNGKEIALSLSAPNDEFFLYCNNVTLPYLVYDENDEVFESGDVFATVTEDRTVTGKVEVDPSDIRVAGEYAGQMIFTVTVNNTSEQP